MGERKEEGKDREGLEGKKKKTFSTAIEETLSKAADHTWMGERERDERERKKERGRKREIEMDSGEKQG